MSQDALTPEQAAAAWDEFATERGDTPVTPAVTPAEETPPEAAPAVEEPAPSEPVPPEQKDPFEGLAPEVKARLSRVDELERVLGQQSNDLKAAIGRVSAIQSEMDRRSAQKAQESPSQAQIAAATKSPEKWEAMKSDFPDWAEAIEEKFGMQRAGVDLAQVEQVLAQERMQLQQNMLREQQALQEQLHRLVVETQHPKWERTVQSPEFQQWFQAQDESTKNLAMSPVATDAIHLLSSFKQAQATPARDITQERKGRLAAAATTRPGQTPPPKSTDDMTLQELWDFEAKQRAQR